MKGFKKLVALLLVLALAISLVPAVFATDDAAVADMSAVDEVWDEINAMTDAAQTKNEATDAQTLARNAAEIVEASDTYVEGSLQWNGNGAFVWQTTAGVSCMYNEQVRSADSRRLVGGELAQKAGWDDVENYDTITASMITGRYGMTKAANNIYYKDYSGGNSSAQTIYLFGPYYGLDSNFTDCYLQQAQLMADKIDAKLWLFAASAATPDAIAKAMQDSKFVLVDSHGTTDYFNQNFSYPISSMMYVSYDEVIDCTSRANTSYICLNLTDNSAVTSADRTQVSGQYGTYTHAVYLGDGEWGIDGTVIANHMTGNSSGGFAWIGVCLGMATDGLEKPLLAKGVGGVYGYSQSITFAGDWIYLDAFTQQMISGRSVARSVATMKASYGNWDPVYRYYYTTPATFNGQRITAYDYIHQPVSVSGWTGPYTPTLTMLQRDRIAFPIVASKNDVYPGQGKVDRVQKVGCDWYLTTPASIHDPFYDVVDSAWYVRAVDYVIENNLMAGTGSGKFSPDSSLDRSMLVTILYRYAGKPAPNGPSSFTDVPTGQWYSDAIAWAQENNIVAGVTETTFAPFQAVTREQMAAIFFRFAGKSNIDTSDRAELTGFSDANHVSAYAEEALQWCVAKGIISGSNGKLNPRNSATRAEFASILMRYITKVAEAN